MLNCMVHIEQQIWKMLLYLSKRQSSGGGSVSLFWKTFLLMLLGLLLYRCSVIVAYKKRSEHLIVQPPSESHPSFFFCI